VDLVLIRLLACSARHSAPDLGVGPRDIIDEFGEAFLRRLTTAAKLHNAGTLFAALFATPSVNGCQRLERFSPVAGYSHQLEIMASSCRIARTGVHQP